MKVNVKFIGLLRLALGRWNAEISLPEGATVGETIDALAKKYGEEFKNLVYDGRGEIRKSLIFMINEKNINTISGFKTALEDGDTLAILPPVGGG